MAVVLSVCYVGQKGNDAGALDGDGQLALMLCAYSAHAAGHDLAALAYVLAKTCGILIIDVLDLIYTETAYLTPGLAGTGSPGCNR